MARTDTGGFRALLTDRAFWLGLLAIGLGLVVFALLFNFAVMPIWTRHDASLTVPDVREMTPSEAESTLRLAGLDGEYDEQPYNPNLEKDIVVDQSPEAGTTVKPGRRVYYYVNASPKDLVPVPDVRTFSEGRARETISEAELVVARVEDDTLRTPFEGTVTRQQPEPGTQVPVGQRITLWVSPGIDESRQVAVPDVVGRTADEARERIRAAGLWTEDSDASGTVTRQDPEAGEMQNPGEEVRIVLGDG